MYKYYIKFTDYIFPTGLVEEEVEVSPINPILFKGEKIGEDEVAFIETIGELKFIGSDFNKLKSREGDNEQIEPVFTIKKGSTIIFEGSFTLRNNVKWCKCEVVINIKTESAITNLIDNWENEINIINSYYTSKTTIPVNADISIKNAIKFKNFIEAIAVNTSELVDSFQSDYFDNNTYFNYLYFVSASDLINYHKITESATIKTFTLKKLYDFLKHRYDLRMFIEGSTLRLEHISYFYENNIEVESIVNNSCYLTNIPLNKTIKSYFDTDFGKRKTVYTNSIYVTSGLGTPILVPYNKYGESENVDISYIAQGTQSYINYVKNENEPTLITDDLPIIDNDFDFAIVGVDISGNYSNIVPGVSLTYDSYNHTENTKINTYYLSTDKLPSSGLIENDVVFTKKKVEGNSACLGNNFDIRENLMTLNRLVSGGETFDIESYEISLRNKTIKYTAKK